MGQQPSNLAVLDKFRTLLAKADKLEEVTDLRSKADAVRVWAKSAAMGLEAQNHAAELKLRAERKAGELLSNLKLRGGDRKSNGHDDRLKLADLGINQTQSKRWQTEARVPEAAFEHYLKHADEMGEEVTAAGLLRLARRVSKSTTVDGDIESPVPHKLPETNHNKLPETNHASNQIEYEFPETARAIRVDAHDEKPTAIDGTVTGNLFETLEEVSNHHSLLCNLLLPICAEKAESLLPAQRKAVCHYLSENS